MRGRRMRDWPLWAVYTYIIAFPLAAVLVGFGLGNLINHLL